MDKGITKKFDIEDSSGNWSGAEVTTDGASIEDPGSGKPYILRIFEFGINPQTAAEMKKKKIKLDKQQLFNSHWQQIRNILWGDGLVANQDVEPRIIVGKKRYRIFLLCEPKFGTMVVDRPNTLQELLKNT